MDKAHSSMLKSMRNVYIWKLFVGHSEDYSLASD